MLYSISELTAIINARIPSVFLGLWINSVYVNMSGCERLNDDQSISTRSKFLWIIIP